MKIALVSAYFYPNSQGGTEKYVLNLAKSLIAQQHQVDVITVFEDKSIHYDYEGIRVYSIPDEFSTAAEILSGKQAADNLIKFKELLTAGNYNLVHFHTLTPAFNLFHIAAAKHLKLEIYFTAHIPGITCIHGDLMKFGETACDGLIKKNRCTACYISKKGINKTVSRVMGQAITVLKQPKSISNVVTDKLADLNKLNQLCDKIFLFTNWQKEIFRNNGFDEQKLMMTNQFLGKEFIPQPHNNKPNRNIGFVGRISHEKGLHILIEAFQSANRKDLQLHIAGIINDKKYFEKLKKITNTDSNIQWQSNLSEMHMDEFYKSIDLLIIPSIWLETGPFVLYEAFEKNIPVIATDLGDMNIWRKKGFNLKLYTNKIELTNLIQQIR